MAIVINGSGTVTGISVGGLPDGIVDAGTLATNSVDSAELIDGSIDNSHIDAMAASKLTGALPAISGASLTGITTGKVLQVLSVNTAAGSTTNAAFTSSGLSLTITPAASSSKFLLMFSIVYETNVIVCGGAYGFGRDSTSTAIVETGKYLSWQKAGSPQVASGQYLDSPATASAITYYLLHRRTGSTGTLLSSANSVPATFTIMEIGA